jgi:hypothetical protein
MDENFKIACFLEHCLLPGKVDGTRVDLQMVEIPLVGITGWGSQHERGEKKSVWMCGEIISPNYIGNNNCACHSHIEGIVMDTGEMRILESVNDFMAHEQSCFEYLLRAKDMAVDSPEFEGDLIARMNRNEFRPVPAGKIYLTLNPYWAKHSQGVSRSNSLPFNNRHYTCGTYIPEFWDKFLGELEEQGYDHPYGAHSDKLIRDREEKLIAKSQSNPLADTDNSVISSREVPADPNNLPF